jgi:exodeoxyribonuclease-3
MVSLATANVNGIRAAVRRGMGAWLETATPDVLCLQEVRAATEDLTAALPGFATHHDPGLVKGRAGVAVASRLPLTPGPVGLPGLEGDAQTGRWIEAVIAAPDLPVPLTVVSVYVPVGELDTPKQQAKHAFLDAAATRLDQLAQAGALAVVAGDFNVAHTERDIKNWRGNIGKRGFTEPERAHLTRWLDELGWVDVGRAAAGEVDGPYTWWSWRGKAFDNDAGWRIDYQFATPALAALARNVRVDRAPDYASRWSDHSPLVVEYRA